MTDRSRWRVVGAPTPPKGPYGQLATAAQALGVAYAGAVQLEVTIDGTKVTLSLEIDSGSVVGLGIEVTLEGAARKPTTPTVDLRLETAGDRAGKAHDINREVQTGDPQFDEQVYIDGDPPDDEVRRLLFPPQTRRAVLRLLDDCSALRVRLTPQTVSARWLERSARKRIDVFGVPHVFAALEALLVIARGGGPRGPAIARRGTWLPPIAVVALLGAFPYLIGVLNIGRVDWRLPAAAMLTTPFLVVLLRPLLVRLVAGDSGSYARLQLVFWVLLLDAAMLGPAVLVHLNAALDVAAPVRVTGTAEAVGPVDSESGKCSTTVRWADEGGTSEYELSPPIAVGDALTVERHPGALGFRWDEHPVKHGRRRPE